MNSGAESDEAEFSDSEDSDASSWCSDEAEVLIHKGWRRDAQTKSSGISTRDWVMNMDGKYDTESPQANAGNSGLPATFNVLTTIEANPKSTRPFHKRNQKRVRAAIRNLSLTSAQIALELGEVLWSKATVHFESPKCFLAFARDRPATLPLIHGIVVDLNIHAGEWLIVRTQLLPWPKWSGLRQSNAVTFDLGKPSSSLRPDTTTTPDMISARKDGGLTIALGFRAFSDGLLCLRNFDPLAESRRSILSERWGEGNRVDRGIPGGCSRYPNFTTMSK